MQGAFINLRSVLRQADSHIWSDALYMPRDQQWSLSTRCIIHNVDDVVDEERDLPDCVIESGFDYILGVQAVQGIVENAKQQLEVATDWELFIAFTFYLKNDAFIEF